MNVRALVFGLIALLAAGGTVMGVKSWLEAQRRAMIPKAAPVAAPKPVPHILVAKENLPQGTLVQAGHVRWQAWPEGGVNDAYVVQGKRKIEELVGSVVRAGIAKGEPVTDSRVVFPGERGFLAAVLEPGMRAITVPIDATSGIAGFVFPGDRVDLILTHSPDGKNAGRGGRKAAETVLADVRVLAIDQRTNDQSSKPEFGKTATLEVTPKQAEMIPIITELGRLSLVLRSLERREALMAVSAEAEASPADPKTHRPGVRGETYTLDSEVSRLLNPPPQAAAARKQYISVTKGGKTIRMAFDSSSGGWVAEPSREAAPAAVEPAPSPAEGKPEGERAQEEGSEGSR